VYRDQFSPLGNAQRAGGVLLLNRAANVGKLSVLKYQEVPTGGNFSQLSDRAIAPVTDDVRMSFEETYRITQLISDRQQL